MASVSLKKATRIYPGSTTPAVDELDLFIEDGEFLVLVGPSGCGKSTTLRMVAGLERADDGQIFIGDNDVTYLPPRSRDIAMIFQSYALYPHLTVEQNIGFNLRLNKVSKPEIRRRVLEVAQMLDLVEYLDRKPAKLSGGQRQRVAMGRAVIREPQVFLMDEPLSNLDAKLRVQTRAQIAALQRRLGITTIYVTHDQIEAMTMGDRVAVMKDGVLQQCATPVELFTEPRNTFVAGFIGSPAMNMFTSRVAGDCATIAASAIPLTRGQIAALTGPEVVAGVRPEGLELVGSGGFAATVEMVEYLGSDAYLYCSAAEHEGDLLVVRAHDAAGFTAGQRVTLAIRPDALHVFDATTGLRLPEA
jgi:multiple sugar transport system ATP-binding protein